jgi:hypothetical protein
MNAIEVRPWDVEVGDSVVGMPRSVVAGVRPLRTVAWSVDQQSYEVALADGRTIRYAGDSWVFVIRGEP